MLAVGTGKFYRPTVTLEHGSSCTSSPCSPAKMRPAWRLPLAVPAGRSWPQTASAPCHQRRPLSHTAAAGRPLPDPVSPAVQALLLVVLRVLLLLLLVAQVVLVGQQVVLVLVLLHVL